MTGSCSRLLRPLLFALPVLATALAPLAALADSENRTTKDFHALLADDWEWRMREAPEYATRIGDQRYIDKLTDASPEAAVRRKEMAHSFLLRLKKIDPTQLSGEDRVSYAVYESTRNLGEQADRIYGSLPFGQYDTWAPVTQMNGLHISFPALARAMPFNTVADYEAYLKRMAALPRALDQAMATMRTGMASGWMPPAIAIARVPQQIAAHLVTDPTKTLVYQPFTKFPVDIPAAEQSRLSEAARTLITAQVTPAFARLKEFVEKTYIPAARKDLGASTLPGGPPYYQLAIMQGTTTAMTAKEIHELGLSEVARIDQEMEATVRQAGFKGTRAEFVHFINTDPQFLFAKPEDMLAAYRDIAKRADAELPQLFAELPRLPYGVRAMEAYEGDNVEHYTAGSGDGSRPGYFEANVLNLTRRSKPTMVAVLLHEAVPGHHLQFARQYEIKNLPNFRRFGAYNAYVEGWALYSESLGQQMGFYQDSYTRFGQLSLEMQRAARLVIDTGIHAFGWDRDRAIAYMESTAGTSHDFAVAEVDRYIVWPGQALGYKVGELRIKALRAKAKSELGEHFDLRRFHNAVLDDGAMPLDVLDQRINAWIAAEQKRG